MTLAVQFTDVQEAFIPVVLFDRDGEPIALPADASITPGSSDNTEVATVSVAPEGGGIVVKSVGDDQPNVGDALISGGSVSTGGNSFALEDVVVAVSVSEPGSAGFSPPTIRDRV